MAVTNRNVQGNVSLTFRNVSAVGGVADPYNVPTELEQILSLAYGTSGGAADLAPLVIPGLTHAGSLTTGATTTIDFRSYTDAVGNTVSTAVRTWFAIKCLTGEITIGNAAATQLVGDGFLGAAVHTFVLKAGQLLVVAPPTGVTVSASVKHLLITETAAQTSTYEMIAICAST